MGGLPSQLLKTSHAIGISIEGSFETSNRRWAVLEDFTGPVQPFVLQLRKGNNRIDQPHLQSLLGVVTTAKKPDFTGFALADQPGQMRAAKAAIKTANSRAGLPKYGIVSRNAQITKQVEHLSAANGVASDQGNDHLGQAADQSLQVKNIEPRSAVLIEVATITSD